MAFTFSSSFGPSIGPMGDFFWRAGALDRNGVLRRQKPTYRRSEAFMCAVIDVPLRQCSCGDMQQIVAFGGAQDQMAVAPKGRLPFAGVSPSFSPEKPDMAPTRAFPPRREESGAVREAVR